MNKKFKKIMALLTVLFSVGFVAQSVYAGCNAADGSQPTLDPTYSPSDTSITTYIGASNIDFSVDSVNSNVVDVEYEWSEDASGSNSSYSFSPSSTAESKTVTVTIKGKEDEDGGCEDTRTWTIETVDATFKINGKDTIVEKADDTTEDYTADASLDTREPDEYTWTITAGSTSILSSSTSQKTVSLSKDKPGTYTLSCKVKWNKSWWEFFSDDVELTTTKAIVIKPVTVKSVTVAETGVLEYGKDTAVTLTPDPAGEEWPQTPTVTCLYGTIKEAGDDGSSWTYTAPTTGNNTQDTITAKSGTSDSGKTATVKIGQKKQEDSSMITQTPQVQQQAITESRVKTMLEYGIKGKYKLIQVALGQNLTSFIDDKVKDLQKTNDLSDTFEIAPAFGSTPAYLLTIYSDPTWVQTKLQEVINNGISAAVSYASAKLKEAEDDIDTSITKAGGLILGVINDSGALNSDINLAAIYYYLEGSRDDGDPGWDGVDATITKNETRKGSGSFEVGFSVFGNDFKIKVGGDYTGTLDISTHNIVANITNDPDECKVQITPKYKEEMSFSVTGSLGIVEATLGASFPDETKILTPKITIKLKADASTQQ